jgi:hypothetical protein
MASCNFCGQEGSWITLQGRKVFIHSNQNRDCGRDWARRLSRNRQKLTCDSFTKPTRCERCDKDCFYYENEFGSKVFFDELGPPWPKHDCIERQQRRPKSPYRWELDGYEPCVIYKALPDVKLQRLEIYVIGLATKKNLALRIIADDIKSFISRLHQPFVLKARGQQKWELNTYAQFYERFEPRAYICTEVDLPWFEEPS